MTHEKGTQLFAIAPDDDKSIEIAKEYIKEHKLTSKDVRLIESNGVIVVVQR